MYISLSFVIKSFTTAEFGLDYVRSSSLTTCCSRGLIYLSWIKCCREAYYYFYLCLLFLLFIDDDFWLESSPLFYKLLSLPDNWLAYIYLSFIRFLLISDCPWSVIESSAYFVTLLPSLKVLLKPSFSGKWSNWSECYPSFYIS